MYTWGSMSKMKLFGDRGEKRPDYFPKPFLIKVLEY
jgi:hypothetical protein